MRPDYLVRFGRVDGSAVKTVFFTSRKSALHLANSLSYVFWHVHAFKSSECQVDLVREERDGFWIEFRTQPKQGSSSMPDFLFQGA